jgi:hypothetical protein
LCYRQTLRKPLLLRKHRLVNMFVTEEAFVVSQIRELSGLALDKLQTGTWVADKLCSSHQIIRTRRLTRIVAIDMSEVVRKTVQQFDGKSFYE